MKKSVKIRKIIFEILNDIYQKSINFEESFLFFTKNISFTEQERSMIYNVVLNSMRFNFFISNILKKYLRKRTSLKIKMLLLPAITQILFLDFKNYAVTNDTVEIAKIKKLNPGLVNSLLKNISNDRELINKKEVDYESIPFWFINKINKNNINLNNLIKNISEEPSLHLVFKDKKFLKDFKEKNFKTTETSLFLLERKKIKEIDDYYEGSWWVQDFSSMLPIYLSPEIKSKKIMDMCSAPGGKAFQTISQRNEVILNDISFKRINVLNDNLKRLKFGNNISNKDALQINENELFDVVILDSPCSGIGTIRRNPEILYKKKSPNFDNLSKIQENLINKAAKLLKKNGVLVYMVCSFFHDETKAVKYKFLTDNKNFSHYKFNLNNANKFNKFIDSQGDFYTLPSEFNGHMIDGFYATKFIKND